MGLIVARKKMTRNEFLTIKRIENNKMRKIILMVVVILMVYTTGRSG